MIWEGSYPSVSSGQRWCFPMGLMSRCLYSSRPHCHLVLYSELYLSCPKLQDKCSLVLPVHWLLELVIYQWKTLHHHLTAKGIQVPKVTWFIHSVRARCGESQVALGILWSNSKRIKNRGSGSEAHWATGHQQAGEMKNVGSSTLENKQVLGGHAHLPLTLPSVEWEVERGFNWGIQLSQGRDKG